MSPVFDEILVRSIDTFFNILFWLILIRVIMSWIRPSGYSKWYADLYQVMHTLTEPIMEPFRRVLPPMGGLDLSPIVALIALQFVRNIITSLL